MRTTRPDVSVETSHGPARAASLILLSMLAACSGSASGPNSGDLVVESCSLGCSSGEGGDFVSCTVVNITENQEISVLFSEPVDEDSLNSTSFQITDADNGTAPEGLRFVDPLDPRRVVFRPMLTFEAAGVSFSFERNRDYEVLIPGEAQGDVGPFIRSITGRPNRSRLACGISTTEGLSDLRPGNPGVQVFVDAMDTDINGDPIPGTSSRVPLSNNVGNATPFILQTSNIYFEFNELMFLPTVAINGSGGNPGVAPFIRVDIDNDGNLATSGSDRVNIPGSYEVFVDQEALTTSLIFDPSTVLPSSGDAPPFNLLLVSIPPQVTDIAGNPVTALTGGGFKIGIPENIVIDPVDLPMPGGDSFDTADQLQDEATGAVVASGRLEIGLSGGSGRHGELVIPDGETVVLSTDSQVFPIEAGFQIDVIGNPDPIDGSYPTSEIVTDGVFELSKLIMGPGSRLELTGDRPCRILVRGLCDIAQGAVIDISGESAPATHNSSTALNDTTPAPGPGGGAGGAGADRADSPAALVTGLPGQAISNPDGVRDGGDGGPIGGTAGPIGAGGGGGGAGFPVGLPTLGSSVQAGSYGGTGMNVGDPDYTIGTGYTVLRDPVIADPLSPTLCVSIQTASPGSGGGHSTAGGTAQNDAVGDPTADWPIPMAVPELVPNVGPTALPSDISGLTLPMPVPSSHDDGYGTRLLNPLDDDLNGGGGGGGGGNHIFGTRSFNLNVPVIDPMTPSQCEGTGFGAPVDILRWLDHSAASGGAGGGAIDIVAGNLLRVRGSILASGGAGGSALTTTAITELGRFASPGGGGAGGAVRLQGRTVEFSAAMTQANLDIQGGAGGLAPWSNLIMGTQRLRGGGGANGLVRVADEAGTVAFADVAERLNPFNTGDVSASLNFLSVEPGGFDLDAVGTARPYTLSGATSCWFTPDEQFFSLTIEDEATIGELIWNMDVVFSDGTTRPYRSLAAPMDGWEGEFGNVLGGLPGVTKGSSIVVRFQGARSTNVADLCNVDPNDEDSGIDVGSMTPWVQHPEELSTVTDAFGNTFSFNMIRYCVIFDRTVDGLDNPGTDLAAGPVSVVGVDNVRITVKPE